jgi:hypothetical protein
MISILNSVFTVVFYPMRWTKLDHTRIYFKEFLNQLNLLNKSKMVIYACLMSYAYKIDKNNLYDL